MVGIGVVVVKKEEIKECYDKILKKIDKPVRFKYPDGRRMNGRLIDRVVMHTKSISEMKDFFDVVDFIKFDVGSKQKDAIRFGYYIYENGKLKWGSQTTLTEEKSELLRLFKKATEKEWFNSIIQGLT